MMLQMSLPVWKLFSILSFLQYPWRYLLFTSFFSSLTAGACIFLLTQWNKYLAFVTSCLIIAVVLVVSIKYFLPQTIVTVNSVSYTNRQQLTWTTSKISDEYMPENFQKPENQNSVPGALIVPVKGVESKILISKTQEKTFLISSKKPVTLSLNLAYFPAWHALLDKVEIPITPTKSGISIRIPSGIHMLRLIFVQTQAELAGDAISLASILILILGIILESRKRAYDRKS